MESYKGFEIEIAICSHVKPKSKTPDSEIEQSLRDSILSYLEVFGRIPEPMRQLGAKDQCPDGSYLCFDDCDGGPWAIRDVRCHPDRLTFFVAYAG
jgi:hypothetical protein